MKKVFIVLLAIASLWACENKPEQGRKTAISGTVNPAIEGYIILSIGGILDSAKITADGNFEMNIDLDVDGTGIVIFDNRFANIYLEPGKDLVLGINALAYPQDLNYAGQLGPVNNYLNLATKLDQNTAISQDELFVLAPDRFIKLTDSILDLKLQLLKEYVMRYPELDSSFISRHKTDIQYAWATQRMQYPGYYALLKREIPDLPDQYHNTYLADLEINNSKLLNSSVFQGFLEDYLDYKQAIYLQNNSNVEKLWYPESVSRFRVIQSEFTDTLVKNHVLFASMNDHLDNYGTEHLETFLTNFQYNCTDQDLIDLIDLKIEKFKNLEKGQPAPVFQALNKDEELVSLSDYIGSLVYINVWATWSQWSLQEFPYWEDLIRKFETRGVKFVSVSLDFKKDFNSWKYLIEDKDLKGIHLFQDPESSIWTEEYFMNDLPRYMVIDKEGKIISVHARRPSENMEDVLERLLAE